MSEPKPEKPFLQELGKMISRPHRLFLLLVMCILGYSAILACATSPDEVFKESLAASKWVLAIIGAIARGPEVMKIMKGGGEK